MITPKESDELKAHISNVRAADEVGYRYTCGHTNKGATEVAKQYADAATGLTNFIQTITEKPMNNVMYPEDSSSSFKLKASVQTYELNLADLAQLFARELGVPADRITVNSLSSFAHGDAIGEGHYVFSGLVVTVKN